MYSGAAKEYTVKWRTPHMRGYREEHRMDRTIYMGVVSPCRTYMSHTEYAEEEDVGLNAADEKELAALQDYVDAQYKLGEPNPAVE